jgi:hypothetical protein
MDQGHPFYQKLQNSKNVLLVKDDVGKPKVSVRDLPGTEHFYGSKPRPDKEGAGALISSWQEHNPTKKEIKQKDFKLLNKMSLDNKLTSAKEVSDFVKDHNNVKVKEKRVKLHKGNDVPTNTYFGVPNKPSTPIDEVVCFGYGNQAAADIRRVYEVNLNEPQVKTKQSVQGNESKKSKIEEEKKEFKLKKFQNVESKVKSVVNSGKA